MTLLSGIIQGQGSATFAVKVKFTVGVIGSLEWT